jgi:hypothetical protein
MNRPLIVTIGITIILLVLGIWVYIFMFGTPEDTREVFTNLGFTPASQSTTITPPEDSPTIETLVDTSTGSLRQLTTRAVAGYTSTTTSTGTVVRYAERGTGYVYDIDLATGVETFQSRTTIPQITSAVFSPDATHVALTSYQGGTPNVFVGTLENGGVVGINLEPGASNLAFTPTNDIRYTIAQNGATTGYRHNLTTETRTTEFIFNFVNIITDWRDGGTKPYLTTKPASTLEGFMYQIDGTNVRPVVRSGLSLTSLVGDTTIITTYRTGDGYESFAVKTGDGFEIRLPITALKEKCVFDPADENFLWCAAPAANIPPDFIDNWYKGTVQTNDMLWLIDTAKESARLVASPEKILSRTLDIISLQTTPTGTALLFKNKTDQTLWLYDLAAN